MTGCGRCDSCDPHCLSRVWFPTAFAALGSDIPPGFHLRVRYVFRVSHPHDVLIPPKTLRPCFMPVTLMGLIPPKASPSPPRLRLSALPTRLTLTQVLRSRSMIAASSRLPGLTARKSVASHETFAWRLPRSVPLETRSFPEISPLQG